MDLSGAVAPGGGVPTVATSLGGVALPPAAAARGFAFLPPAAVSGALKTATVYVDDATVAAAYWVADGAGRTAVAPEGVAVALSVTLPGVAGSPFVSICGAFSAAQPFGSCVLPLPASAFPLAADGSATVVLILTVSGAVVATAPLGAVALARPRVGQPLPPPAPAAGTAGAIYGVLPQHVAFPGDTVALTVWAATGTYDMGAWGLNLGFDPSLLSFVGLASPNFATVKPGLNAAFGWLNASGVGLATGVAPAAVTGSFVLATATFRVLDFGSATANAVFTLPGLYTSVLTTGGGGTFAASVAGAFAGGVADGFTAPGVLRLATPQPVAIYAYSSARATLVDTTPMDGGAAGAGRDAMATAAVFSSSRVSAFPDAPVAPASCSSPLLATVPGAGGCGVMAAGRGGARSAPVTATLGALSATISYRIFAFSSFELAATRPLLRPLGCGFETSVLSASAVASDGVAASPRIDVTRLVTFSSGNPSAVAVAGRVATGVVASRSATVSFGAPLLASLPLSTGAASSPAAITRLAAFPFSSVATGSSGAGAQLAELAVATVSSAPELSLASEGASATVAAFALGDDGIWTDVSTHPNLALGSALPADVVLSRNSGAASWRATVPLGATSIDGAAPVITASFSDACGAILFPTQPVGFIVSTLAIPFKVTLTSGGVSRLARPGTPAATALFLPTSASLVVTVFFNGTGGTVTSTDFTADGRTVYTPTFASCGGAVSATGQLALAPSSGAGAAGAATVAVSFPSFAAAAGLSASITLPVVDIDASVPLQAALVHSAPASASRVSPAAPLSLIGCTSAYQTGALVGLAVTLTDGSVTAVAAPTSVFSSRPSVASVSPSTFAVAGVSPGTAQLTVAFATSSVVLSVPVAASSAAVASLSLSYPIGATLSGPLGATSPPPTLGVVFSDGTSFSDLFAQFPSPGSLVSFSSDDPVSLPVSVRGIVTLASPSWRFATITAASACPAPSPPTASAQLAANLYPSQFDTKLGSFSGLAFPPVPAGGAFSFPVTVAAGGATFTAYQLNVRRSLRTHAPSLASFAPVLLRSHSHQNFKIRISHLIPPSTQFFYDPTVFGVPVVTQGPGWATGSFVASVGNPVPGSPLLQAIVSAISGSATGAHFFPIFSLPLSPQLFKLTRFRPPASIPLQATCTLRT